jgi:tetratricopeptide (TPR) repeat protein
MIVKNEAPTIERCLRSVLPFIDSWVVCDTGSTDGTQAKVIEFFGQLSPKRRKSGALFEHDWVSFDANRNSALWLAWERADYALVVDADDVLAGNIQGNADVKLTSDIGFIEVIHENIRYWRAHYMKKGSGVYHGILHEVFVCNPHATIDYLANPKYHYLSGGARFRDPETFRKDIETLRRALGADPNGELATRYQYYLAKTLAGAGDLEGAIEAFTKRVLMGGPQVEEIWCSLYMQAQCMMTLDENGTNQSAVIDAFMWAYDFRPERVEPLRDLAKYLECTGRTRMAHLITQAANRVPLPERGMFLDVSAYGELKL